MDKSIGTPSLEEKKTRPNCANKTLMCLQIVFPPLLQQFLSALNDCTHMYKSLVFGDEFVAHLKSHQRCSASIIHTCKDEDYDAYKCVYVIVQ